MSAEDRRHWDDRYRDSGAAPVADFGPPAVFVGLEAFFPTEGSALEIACGRGRAAVWLAKRGLEYVGVDVSPIAVGFARDLAGKQGFADRCRFDVWDLDRGLPPGPAVDLLFCYLFRDPRLDRALMSRLALGGTLAIAVLSEVGAGAGRFRSPPGDLTHAFAELTELAADEVGGTAWFVGKRET